VSHHYAFGNEESEVSSERVLFVTPIDDSGF
jgi:hypothetical protein